MASHGVVLLYVICAIADKFHLKVSAVLFPDLCILDIKCLPFKHWPRDVPVSWFWL